MDHGLFPWDAITQTYEIAKREKTNFISLYLPFVDPVSLRFGSNSPYTERVAKEVYSLAESLAKDLSNDYNVIITSDHDHIEVEGL